MSPFEWVLAAVAVVLLLIAYRLVDGLLKSKEADRRGQKVKAQTLARLEKLEAELSRLPKQPVAADELEEVRGVAAAALAAVKVAEKTLITREAAERIVNQVNAVSLDVEALKDWQRGLETAEALGGVLDPTLGREKAT